MLLPQIKLRQANIAAISCDAGFNLQRNDRQKSRSESFTEKESNSEYHCAIAEYQRASKTPTTPLQERLYL